MSIKILTTRSLLQGDVNYIKEGLSRIVGDSFEIINPETYDEEGILKLAPQADVLLGPFVTEKILENSPNLRLIQVPWTGMDTFNFSAMKNSDVPVCNSHSNAIVVAEIGFGIVMDLLKKISYHDRKMRVGNWNRDQQPLDLKSKMLSQQKVCIFGYGNIGSKLGRMFSSFGAEVIAVTADTSTVSDVKCYSPENAAEALAVSDVVVITVPLTEGTKDMVNSEFIASMKDGSYLVTLSRAAVVNEDALYEALMSGKIAGYGSDVWWRAPKRGESESKVSDKYDFEKLDQVVLSPHRAGFSENSLPHLDDVIVNLAKFIKGEPLINTVNVKEEY